MMSFLVALLPVLGLIAVGHVMHRRKFLGDAFWPLADRLVYFVCFPALLVVSIGNGRFRDIEPGPLALTLFGSIFLLTGLLWLLRPWLAANGPAFTSVFQGAIRFNTFVALGIVSALHGQEGIAIFSLVTGLVVPVLNVLCVITLARFGNTGSANAGLAQIVGLILRNPLVLACIAGLALNLSGIGIHAIATSVLETLGRAALPLGLLAVGAGLDFSLTRNLGRELPIACLFKLVLMPLAIAGFAQVTGLDGVSRSVVLIWAVMPTASSAYILSRQLGGDSPLMAVIITVETLLAFVAAPVALTLLG